MQVFDHQELERRLRLNEVDLEGVGKSKGDLGVGETLIFVFTLVAIVLATLLWRQM